jgi:predicted flavoprotein YhiN
LKSRLGLDGIKSGLLHEQLTREENAPAAAPGRGHQGVAVARAGRAAVDEAISTAGGVRFEALDANLMIAALPGVFCAGEMLDWEAPTGGYLLTLSMASGLCAAHSALRWV